MQFHKHQLKNSAIIERLQQMHYNLSYNVYIVITIILVGRRSGSAYIMLGGQVV